MRIGFARHTESPLGGLGTDVDLAGVPQRERAVPQLVLIQHAQHIGLILGLVHRPPQTGVSVLTTLEKRVVAGGDQVEPQRHTAFEDSSEFDLLVASQAWIRRPASSVFTDEIFDDIVDETIRKVPDVEGDAEPVSGTTRIVCILLRATSSCSGAERQGVLRESQMDARHVMTGIDHACRGHRRIDTTGHGCQNPHLAHLPFAWGTETV